MLIDEAPNQLKVPYAVWSRQPVHIAFKKKFKVTFHMRTINGYLKR